MWSKSCCQTILPTLENVPQTQSAALPAAVSLAWVRKSRGNSTVAPTTPSIHFAARACVVSCAIGFRPGGPGPYSPTPCLSITALYDGPTAGRRQDLPLGHFSDRPSPAVRATFRIADAQPLREAVSHVSCCRARHQPGQHQRQRSNRYSDQIGAAELSNGIKRRSRVRFPIEVPSVRSSLVCGRVIRNQQGSPPHGAGGL
jgi:hypothetical protein